MIAPSRDTHNNWNDKDPVILEGVLGFTKDRLFSGSLEYFVGDGIHKYSELPKYGGAEASSTKKNNTLVLRDGSGKIDSDSLPEATSSSNGVVKASTTTSTNTVVKSDNNGSLSGWKDSIINSIIDPNGTGGLGTDSSGNLMVDFSQMPTDKFEDLLKSLKMLIPLSANMDLYVNTNHSDADDTIIDGRGTQNLPFKTIQAAVNFVTRNYSVGSYTVTIYIASGTYNEEVALPTYSRTSGNITLTASDLNNPPTITNTHTEGSSTGITVSGGLWYLNRLTVTANFSDPNNGYAHVGCGIEISGGSTSAYIQSCSVSCTFNGTSTDNNYDVRVISVNNGATCRFRPISGYSSSLTCDYGNAKTGDILCIYSNGTVDMVSVNLANDDVGLINQVNGVSTTFARISTGSKLVRTGGGLNFQSFSGTLTGKKYIVTTSSYIIGPAATNLPGDDSGTVDTDTFCYYKVG